ncbi:Peptidoglycan glycosyltransferase MrdB [Parvicella tangerina]|uniref:Peptidoglycan glycosyltransferase MrdB n=2 Tax=Parvicella tangerina TaxID=2829795 RepID=A0A916JNW0_9FLAO|nr:Peptidoglycan glycosyltransferase MrdB [Parvicella tangerina]
MDKWFLVLYLILVVMGFSTVYSAGIGEAPESIFSWSTDHGKQFYWILISFFMGFVILLLEGSFIRNMSYIVYGVVLLMLITVLFMPEIKGAHSWFKIGSFTIQPAEFAKVAAALAVARYLSQTGVKIENFSTKRNVFLLLVVPMALIVLEPDPGTGLVFLSFIFVMYREGLSGNILIMGLFALIIGVLSIYVASFETVEVNNQHYYEVVHADEELFAKMQEKYGSSAMDELYSKTIFSSQEIPEVARPANFFSNNYWFAIVLLLFSGVGFILVRTFVLPRYRKKYYPTLIWGTLFSVLFILSINWAYDNVFQDRHRTRFQIQFGLKEDRLGDGYNIYQALSAIGSGELMGKGYLDGTLSNNKYKHVPEQSTDFIFCSWAEERGFVGSLVLVVVYTFFLLRAIIIAERQRSIFTRIFAYCVASILFFHFMINLGMVIGLAPVIGIPLPFFSKGGSAILGFSALVFILLRLDAERKDVLR